MLSKEQHDELCVSYASLLLCDGEAEITAERLNTVISASGNSVEPYWPMLFAGMLSKEGKMMDLISSGGGASGSAPVGAVASEGAADTASDSKKEDKVEEEDEVDFGDGGLNMFGDDEADY